MIPDVKRRLAEAYKNLQDAAVSVDTILHVSCSGSSYIRVYRKIHSMLVPPSWKKHALYFLTSRCHSRTSTHHHLFQIPNKSMLNTLTTIHHIVQHVLLRREAIACEYVFGDDCM